MRDPRRAALTAMVFLSAATAVAVFYRAPISRDVYGDLRVHVALADEMSVKREIVVPHFFFHLVTILTASAMGIALKPTAIALTMAAQGVTCLLLICIMRYGDRILGLSRPVGTETAVLAGFALSFVGPLSLLSYPTLYLGYPGISVAHSPTMILLRPPALALFVVTLRLLASRSWSQWVRLAIVAAILLAVGGLTKPSYNVCLAPALALLLLFRFRREGSVSRVSLATFALLAVSISALTLWQFSFVYAAGTGAGITLAPLKVLSSANDGSGLLTVAKLGLGLAFPIFVTFAYGKGMACASDAFRLSWLATFMAIGSGYLLAETGPRAMHGNLLWSLQVCLLILMTASLAVFLSEEDCFHGGAAPVSWKALAGSLLFLLHFFSGLLHVIVGVR